MDPWTGTLRASAESLAQVFVQDTSCTAVAATGPAAIFLRDEAAQGRLNAQSEVESHGEYAMIERGSVHCFVQASPNSVVMIRGEDDYVDTMINTTQMVPLEAARSALLLVGVPFDRIDRKLMEAWLVRGARPKELDKLLLAWGEHALAVIQSWEPQDEVAKVASTSLAPLGQLPTIPPPALLSGSPLGNAFREEIAAFRTEDPEPADLKAEPPTSEPPTSERPTSERPTRPTRATPPPADAVSMGPSPSVNPHLVAAMGGALFVLGLFLVLTLLFLAVR